MTSTLTQQMGIYTAKRIKAAIANTTNAYLAIARVESWANDATPDQANSSVASAYSFWRNMIGGKRIGGGDVSHVIPRRDWSANIVVIPYSSQASSLTGSANLPYVLTEDFNVYKCLFNNGNANSSIKPVSTNPNTTYSTADGYVWKYMYSLTDVDRIKFLTADWMPVRTLVGNDGSLQWRVQQAATDGAVHVIRLTSGGSSYSNASNVIVTLSGDGSSATATANVNTSTNTVQSITITSSGSGYTFGNVAITGGAGSGATAVLEIEPPGGHGADAITELGGHYLMFNPRLKADENQKLTVSNDFRQIALLFDPLTYGTSNAYSSAAFNQMTTITVSGSGSSFAADETVFQGASAAAGTFSAELVDFDSANNTARVVYPVGTTSSGALIGETTAASRFVTAVTNPDLEYYSGQIVYIDNVTPVVRNASQTEDIKIVISYQF